MIRVSPAALIEFFDKDNEENSEQASAINGVAGEELALALLCHYLNEKGFSFERVNEPCTTGRRRGKWLDWWLKVTKDQQAWLYQIEVKNWSTHSIDGKQLLPTASIDEIQKYCAARWTEEWDSEREQFRKEAVNKVLTPMRPPPNFGGIPVKPLVCYWRAIHTEHNGNTLPTPMSTVALNNSPFENVSVFSLSIYLRSLDGQKLDLDMPEVERRLSKLNQLFHKP